MASRGNKCLHGSSSTEKVTKFNRAKLIEGIKGLTPAELLLYSVLLYYKNDNTHEVYAPKESLKDFIKIPNKLKFDNLEKKGFIKCIDSDYYKVVKVPAGYVANYKIIYSNKYRDIKSLIYGLIKTFPENTLVSTEQLSTFICVDRTTLAKQLKEIQEIKCISKRIPNTPGGKKCFWSITDNPDKLNPYRPDYILYYKDMVKEEDPLELRLLKSYYYTINKLGKDPDEKEIRNLIGDCKVDYKFEDDELEPTGPAIKIPIYSKFVGLDLAILSLISNFRLKGQSAIWSLNAFKEYFGGDIKQIKLACKKLIKQKYLSTVSQDTVDKWKEYINSSCSFKNAVTVTKQQNIILKYCYLTRRSS